MLEHSYGWLSLVPPLVAIVIAIISRQVILSLFLGVWMGWTIILGNNPIEGMAGALAQLVSVFQDGYNTKVILFSALVGSLITLTQRSGGVEGFVRWMQARNIGNTHRGAGLVAFLTGVFVFVESSITCLVVGAVARPLSDRVKMAREKLAYICDSTSAPVCILIPLNAWGAYVMGLLALQDVDSPLKVLVSSIAMNFYAWAALIMVLVVVLFDFNIGPMRKAERRARETGKLLSPTAIPMIADDVIGLPAKEGIPLRPANMLIPLLVMIFMMPVGLYITGHGEIISARQNAETNIPVLEDQREDLAISLERLEADTVNASELGAAIGQVQTQLANLDDEIATAREKASLTLDLFTMLGQGSGSTAVFWAVFAAIVVAGIMYLGQQIFNLNETMTLVLKGAGGLMPMAVIMLLAFAINATCAEMKTGEYVAEIARRHIPIEVVPVILFLVSSFIAFSTGTSWGTFGIMMPIGVPLVIDGGPLTLIVAAILSGGVYGDHCSPISDTSVISSMATASDHIDHVRTQLPYALIAAAVAAIAFLVMGYAI